MVGIYIDHGYLAVFCSFLQSPFYCKHRQCRAGIDTGKGNAERTAAAFSDNVFHFDFEDFALEITVGGHSAQTAGYDSENT